MWAHGAPTSSRSISNSQQPGSEAAATAIEEQGRKYRPLPKVSLDEIDEQFVAKYVKWRRSTTRTRAGRRENGRVHLVDTGKIVSIARVNRDLATLRRILNVAREWKVIIIPPKIRLLPGEKTHDRVLSHEEENAYLQAAAPLLRDFAVIALDTGMRPEEILRMRFENVKFDPAGSASPHFS